MATKTFSLGALVMALLMVFPATLTSAQESEPAEPNLEAEETVTNYLEIDGTSGSVVTYVYNGVEITDVRVTGVPADGKGFKLVEPLGWTVWENQFSTSDGQVEFWSVRLVSGQYRVTQVNSLELEVPITVFNPPTALTNPLLNICDSLIGTRTLDVGADASTEFVWTPLMFVHSPRYGSATANSGNTDYKGIYIFPFSYNSETTTTRTLTANDGYSYAYSRQAKWGTYSHYTYSCAGAKYHGETARVYQWSSSYNPINLDSGNSRNTDRDDTNRFCNTGSQTCLTVNLRYAGENRRIYRCSGSGSVTEGTSDRYGLAVGAGVSVNAKFVSAEVFRLDAGFWDEFEYRYTFNCGSPGGHWRIDELPGRQQVWAFSWV